MTFQTLTQFLQAPFGKPEVKSNEFEDKYKKLRKEKRIHVEGYTLIEDNYLMHIKVGSDTNRDHHYDVVIMFFTDDDKVKKESSLQNYYIKFFSNSPSFIYQYAALYKSNGFLIDFLFDKLDSQYADIMPEKANSGMKMSYDKSIYSACRFLQDDRFIILNKMGIVLRRKKTPERFFAAIQDFTDVKFTQNLRNIDRQIDKELEKQKTEKRNEKKRKRTQDTHRNKKTGPKKNTLDTKSSISYSKQTKVVRGNAKISPKTRTSPKHR